MKSFIVGLIAIPFILIVGPIQFCYGFIQGIGDAVLKYLRRKDDTTRSH